MSNHSSKWPGEWHPARNDVALASEAPDPVLLADFKTRLLASQDARGVQDLMHVDLSKDRSDNEYTYPLALLSQLPSIPEHFELLRLWQQFLEHKGDLAFVGSVPVALHSRETVPPHLLLAAASFALVSEGDLQRASEVFDAAASMWSVMLEIDNRETRTEDTLIAGMLLCLYGPLEATFTTWRWAKVMQYAVATIARRRRLHDCHLLEDANSEFYGSAIAALWLADLLLAIHLDAPMNFSTQEMNISMTQSSHSIQDLRATLLHDEPLPHQIQGREDALLLLLALLTDAIYLQRSVGRWAGHLDPINPFVPLSPHTEHQRMHTYLCCALDRWSQTFAGIDPDIMVLHHYSRLYLAFPRITSVASSVGYPGAITATKPNMTVPDAASKYAWQILDTSAAASSSRSTGFCSPWLPVALFHAGLAIWVDISTCTSVYAPSKRILVPFILELQNMGWPCARKMASTLETLMTDGKS